MNSLRLLSLLLVVCFFAVASSPAAEPPAAPVLRIEAGMHTVAIRRISVDAAGQLALTVSDDKTARLWELPGGRLLRVLRPRVGEGTEGMLYAGALSPNGALAAVGGFTSNENGNSESIYLFDTTTGRMMRRIEGLPSVVFDLAFSPQGRFLAAVLGEGNGLRVWETATGREVGQDINYRKSNSFGVDWHGEDRLVTTCWDGNLRLYRLGSGSAPTASDGKLTLLKKNAVKGGKEPYSARFSPDGRWIAIGFSDSTSVAVVDGTDLSFLFAPDTTGIGKRNLESVTWTDDGATLAAGGTWNLGANFQIRRWPEAGRGKPRDSFAASDTIMDLRSLSQGRILFGASGPAWGVLGSTGERQLLGLSPLADYRNNCDGFRLATGGTTVAFGYQDFGKTPAQFSLSGRQLTLLKDQTASNRLQAPRIEGLKVTDWENTVAPKLDGRPLTIERYERSHSLAIARDASSFLLGADWHLRSFTAKGQKRWEMAAPSATWAVNLTDTDRVAVAAYADGTIRWHRADTGRELLAFFPHADRRRWVLWAPEGYFDCSPGAEDLIGWHVNRGKDQAADFFSASRFRNIYYRPDVISRVLETRDVSEALRQANRERGLPETKSEGIAEVLTRLSPPVVELETGGIFERVKLPAEARDVSIRYRVRQTGAEPPIKVTVRFNGRLLDIPAPLPKRGETVEIRVPVPTGMTGEISVLAEHRLAVSEPAVLRIEREGAAHPRQSDLYVISVGVAKFKMNEGHPIRKAGDLFLPDLEHAADDARQVGKTFETQNGKLYHRVILQSLTDREATAPALRAALRSVAKQAGAEDVAVFFFSGHGVVDPKVGFYLATHEADLNNPAATALTGKELSTLLEGIKARTVLALDTCHSGGAFGGARLAKVITSPNDLTGLVNELSSAEQGTVVMSSSGASQESLEDPVKGGLFTVALCEGMEKRRAADGKDGEPNGATVSCAGLRDWLTKRVPELVAALVTGAPDAPQQTPACVIPKGVPDFPIAVKQ